MRSTWAFLISAVVGPSVAVVLPPAGCTLFLCSSCCCWCACWRWCAWRNLAVRAMAKQMSPNEAETPLTMPSTEARSVVSMITWWWSSRWYHRELARQARYSTARHINNRKVRERAKSCLIKLQQYNFPWDCSCSWSRGITRTGNSWVYYIINKPNSNERQVSFYNLPIAFWVGTQKT